MKKLVYILIFFLGLTSCLEDKDLVEPQIPDGPESTVLINEVMSNNVGNGVDWIEIYNAGSEAVDLEGYKLNDAESPESGWAIPAGNVVEAGGYIVFDENEWDFGGVSSSGEWVSFADAAGTLIDKIYVTDMSANAGLTYAREVDGEEPWLISSPTKGGSNGDVENTAPILVAEPLTELTEVYSVAASDADGIASVKLVYMVNDGVISLDMSLVGSEYKTSVPKAKVGDVVKYYVIATDNTGLSTVYPEGGLETPGEYTVIGGIKELVYEGAEPGYRGVVTFIATPHYADQVDEVRLYYFLPGQTQDDKQKIIMTEVDGVWTGDVPAQNTDDVVSYYLRVEYTEGTKTYYPMEEEGSDFDHDIGTTWPTYTVEAISYDDVVETTVTYTQGPLTSVVFPSNPVPGTDINVVLAYTSAETIDEARIYFDVRETPAYVKANKVKGEDDASFTQTGVTINLADVDAEDEAGVFSGNTGVTGTTVTFYVRIATATAEYYYGSDGSMYLDDTPGGGTTDQSDAFKADPTLWNVYNVQ